MNKVFQIIQNAIVAGNVTEVEERVHQALDAKFSPEEVLNKALVVAMEEVGDCFERGQVYVPEMLIAARAMQAGLALLKPQLIETGIEAAGKVVIGTVKGDLHDIGKNLVAMMLEGSGFEILDLGMDVPHEKFAIATREFAANLVGISAMLTTTMQDMRGVIEALEDLSVRGNVKVIIGGAPITPDFAKEIGADGYAPDAVQAVALAKSLL